MIGMLWAFLRRDLQHEASYKLAFALQVLANVPVILLFLFLGKLFGRMVPDQLKVYGGKYFPFVLVGIAVQNYLVLAMNNFSGRLREAQLTGTLEAELATPVPLPLYLAGSSLYAFFLKLLHFFIYIMLGCLLGGITLDLSRLPLVLLTLLLSAAAFSCLGILAASFIVVFKKGDPVTGGFMVLSWLLGGVYFPLSLLPGWLKSLSACLPTTQCLEALRLLLLANQGFTAIARPLAWLAGWTLVGLPLCYCVFHAAVKLARRKGSLGQY